MGEMFDDDGELDLPPPDLPELEPICFELANGHTVKIEARFWPGWQYYEDWISGLRPEPYFAIRVYCTQDTLPKRLTRVEEFRGDIDFCLTSIWDIWLWIGEFTSGRGMFDFDSFEDFSQYLSESIARLSANEPDADEHYRQLSQLTAPQWFDRIDDSIFNDQNDSGHHG